MAKILSLFETEYDLAKALIKGDAYAQRMFYEKFSHRFLADILAIEWPPKT
jgi:hypothetical protein